MCLCIIWQSNDGVLGKNWARNSYEPIANQIDTYNSLFVSKLLSVHSFFLSQCAIGQLLTKSNKTNYLIGGNYGAKFENLEGFECKQIARKLKYVGYRRALCQEIQDRKAAIL